MLLILGGFGNTTSLDKSAEQSAAWHVSTSLFSAIFVRLFVQQLLQLLTTQFTEVILVHEKESFLWRQPRRDTAASPRFRTVGCLGYMG